MKNYLILFCLILLVGCKNENPKNTKTDIVVPSEQLTANAIIDKAIAVAGGDKFKRSSLKFEFRGTYYQALRKNHEFLLVRLSVNGKDSIFDMLSNVGFERYNNEVFVTLEDSIAKKYEASVNSVHYFSVLPYGLNDKAVNKSLLGSERINDKDYHKIKVTFDEEGGGEDHDDIFIYWVNKTTFKVDYLAYSYKEVDGIGQRFRTAYNERYINGLRFVDYNNYTVKNADVPLDQLGKAFEAGELDLLSKIELENIKVELLNL